RSRGAAQSAARHDQDAHSFGTAQATARIDRGSGEVMSTSDRNRCEQSEVTCAYAAQALAASEMAAVETHIAACPDCRGELVSLRVRLAPGASYPAHTHAGVEELHLLDGELWIDEKKLVPGDYNYGGPGEGDERVWSKTGCTCVLITSTKDILR